MMGERMEQERSVRTLLERVCTSINEHETDITATYQFMIEDGDTHRLVVVDGHCELALGEGEATSTVITSAADAEMIFSGQFDAMKAFMEGRMRIEGDLMAMSTLQAFMPGGTASGSGPTGDGVVDYIAPSESPAFQRWIDRAAERVPEATSLREVATARGFFVGAAVAAPNNASGELVLHREFNCLGAENAFKWSRLAKFVGNYDFTSTDAFVDYARRHDMRLRGHALIWGRGGRPDDLESTIRASADDPAVTLRRLMREHIETVAGRYRGDVAVWDVVNEPMAYGGVGLDHNVFFETLGEDYVAESFELARATDPDAELVLNEQISATDYAGVSAREFLDLVKRLLARDAPVDGVGLQGHMLTGIPDRQAFHSYLREIEDLGLFIELTEMDMRIGLFAGTDDPLGAQADAYNELAETLAGVPAVRGVMMWGAADNESWLDHFPPFDAGAPNQPVLFDRELSPKPAYYAFLHGLASRPPR